MKPFPRLSEGLGVLIDPLSEREFALGRPAEHTYAHLGTLCRAHRQRVTFFSPNGVDMARKQVTAWHHTSSGWERDVFPLPDAVYNRLARRSLEGKPSVRRLLRRVAEARPLFNPYFLKKDEALQALADHLVPAPRFTVVREPTDALRALKSWGTVYLKPVEGSLGRGIVKLEPARGSGGEPLVAMWAEGAPAAPVARTISDAEGMVSRLAPLIESEAYIAQEGVPLACVDGRPVDLRMLVQRSAGAWRLTGVGGRVAPRGHVTTHTVRGGRAVPFSRVQAATGVSMCDVEVLAQHVAGAIEARSGVRFFEFSADVAVTAGGALWVLEVNSKPFPFDEEEIRNLAARRLLEYVGGQGWNGPEPSSIG